MRIAIYARVSTTHQETENQLAQLRAYVERHYGLLVETVEYIDQESGTKSTRPAFQHMLKAASQRRFDVLLFWSLDRLTREGVLETLQYLRQLAGWGVLFKSYQEPYIETTGPFADVFVALLAGIANFEVARRRERVKAGLSRAKEKGTRSGKAIGRPAVENALRNMIGVLSREGLSIRQIAAHESVLAWNEGKPLGKSSVAKYLGQLHAQAAVAEFEKKATE